MTKHLIRKATPAELPALLDIDDQASALYLNAGLSFDVAEGHPYLVAESLRWEAAIARGFADVAADEHDFPIGFSIVSWLDGAPYLDQLSVHPKHMRQGIGAALLENAVSWAADKPLWLTTYDHLRWNKNFYERHGFAAKPSSTHGKEMAEVLTLQRLALPAPENRIAMARLASAQCEKRLR